MQYKKLTNEELSKCKYPNLIAEIIESGYSTSTLADFMGIGAKKNGEYRPDGDPEVWGAIIGTAEMTTEQAFGLARYYQVKIEYMFSSELTIVNGKPMAYWNWSRKNKKQGEIKLYSINKTMEMLGHQTFLSSLSRDSQTATDFENLLDAYKRYGKYSLFGIARDGFTLGYIHGKRAERARRKRTGAGHE